MAVLPRDANPDLFLYFALAQLPIYLMPTPLAWLVRRANFGAE